ncbi:CRIB domain-containing protein RIC4-like [Chenopodium quinoa]|uniref:CRIB domain-containing protein RIC4-like n=1 Tax=Chenopodium quinoa TaxID=63459 RepID=UPI000B76F0A1|nr:CRIB domain-containing protein RIC4-like [Chenopodium quinoa]
MSKDMKERRERWIILPFSFGCSSRSSIAVGSPSPPNDAVLNSRQGKQNDLPITKKTMNSISFKLPKSKLSQGIRRLIRSLKTVSQFFVYKEEMDVEEEKELEIGFPTDVKHLTHIGWDGSTTVSNDAKGWENLTPSEIISFPSISLKQFEVAMAEQAAAAAAVGEKPV